MSVEITSGLLEAGSTRAPGGPLVTASGSENAGSSNMPTAEPARAVPHTPNASRTPTGTATIGVGDQEKRVTSCRCGPAARNLIVCIDGTSNQFSERNTNVVELYSRLVKDDHQLTFYNSGIGTYATPSWKSLGYYAQQIMNALDLALALRFEKIIISAYAWLADNYRPGDRIFLFGFSRGAYQVRALSAMIHLLGLIHKGNDDQIPFAYELYHAGRKSQLPTVPVPPFSSAKEPARSQHGTHAASRPDSPVALPQGLDPSAPEVPSRRASLTEASAARADESSCSCIASRMRTIGCATLHAIQHAFRLPSTTRRDIRKMQERFKTAFARDVTVHFVGAWDTVSSVGIARSKTLPGTTDGMNHVCFFRHALAIHEYRVKFLPEFVNGGYGPWRKGPHRDPEGDETSAADSHQNTESPALPGPYGDLRPHVKEVWFPGCHSDIGGGATENAAMDNFGPSLRWMSFEARVAGARFLQEPKQYDDSEVPLTRSLKPLWWLLEVTPFRRLTYRSPEGTTHRPHLASHRVFQGDQLLSWCVKDDVKGKFKIKTMAEEKDPYTDAEAFLGLLRRVQAEDVHGDLWTAFEASLRAMVGSVPGLHSLRGVTSAQGRAATGKATDDGIITMLLNIAQLRSDAKPRHLEPIIEATVFGLVFSFDGTDSLGIGRNPRLAVDDFYTAAESRISSLRPLNTIEKQMLMVLTSLNTGHVVLRATASKAVATMRTIPVTLDSPAVPGLFAALQSIMCIEGVACAFDSAGRIIKPDKCDMIAVGSVVLQVLPGCIEHRRLPSPREHEMLKVLRKADAHDAQDPLSSLESRLFPVLLALLPLLNSIRTESPAQDARRRSEAIISDVQYILDNFALRLDRSTSEFRRLHQIIGSGPRDTNWTVPKMLGGDVTVKAVAFLPSQDRIVTASHNSIQIWNIHTGAEETPSPMSHTMAITGLAVSRSGKIVSGFFDGLCIVWDSITGKQLSSTKLLGTISSVAFSATERLAIGDYAGNITVQQTGADAPTSTITLSDGHTTRVLSVAFSPSNPNLLASSFYDRTLVWDLASGTHSRLEAQTDWVRSLAFCPTGSFLAAGSDDGRLMIWDMRTQIAVHTMQASSSWVNSIAYSPSGRHLVSGAEDGQIRLWDTNTGLSVGEALCGHRFPVISLGTSQDGNRIVSCGQEGKVRIWDRVPFLKGDKRDGLRESHDPEQRGRSEEPGGTGQTRSHSLPP